MAWIWVSMALSMAVLREPCWLFGHEWNGHGAAEEGGGRWEPTASDLESKPAKRFTQTDRHWCNGSAESGGRTLLATVLRVPGSLLGSVAGSCRGDTGARFRHRGIGFRCGGN